MPLQHGMILISHPLLTFSHLPPTCVGAVLTAVYTGPYRSTEYVLDSHLLHFASALTLPGVPPLPPINIE